MDNYINIRKRRSKAVPIIISVFAIILGIVFLFCESKATKSTDDENENSSVSENLSENTIQVADDNSYGNIDEVVDNDSAALLESQKKQKEKTLEDAVNKSENGDYIGAINTIKRALTNDSEDEDYKNALDDYTKQYRHQIILEADALSNQGDYLGAMNKLRETNKVLGSDSEIDAKVNQYEKLYVSDTVLRADKMTENGDYDQADSIIDQALKDIPGNSELLEAKTRISDSRPMTGEQIVNVINDSLLTSTGYTPYLGGQKTVNAYGEERNTAITIECLASYNLWTSGVSGVAFRVDQLNFDILKFTVCGEKGTSGEVDVEILVDKQSPDAEPDMVIKLEDAAYPKNVELNISSASTLTIRVHNMAGHGNTIVFYDFEGI